MAKYKKRKDGRYSTSITVGYDANRKRKQKIIYGKTIREVDEKIAEIKAQLNKGIVIDDKGLTVEQWAERWLELYKSNVEYNTYEMYRNAVEKHINKALGGIKLSTLKTSHAQELINSLVKDGKNRTAEIVGLTLGQMIDQAITNELIYKDIMRGVKSPKKKKPQKRALTDTEKMIIAKADLEPKIRAFLDVLLYTGVRRSEALALTAQDIDVKKSELHITKTVIFKGNRSEIKDSPKSDAGYRTIPIPNMLMQTLRSYLQTLDGIYLFPMQTRPELMTLSSFTKFWNRTKKQLTITEGGKEISLKDSDVTPHTFRHTYATSLYYGGVDIKTAQYLLGHSSIQITMDIYTHLEKEGIKSAAERIEKLYEKNVW